MKLTSINPYPEQIIQEFEPLGINQGTQMILKSREAFVSWKEVLVPRFLACEALDGWNTALLVKKYIIYPIYFSGCFQISFNLFLLMDEGFQRVEHYFTQEKEKTE